MCLKMSTCLHSPLPLRIFRSVTNNHGTIRFSNYLQTSNVLRKKVHVTMGIVYLMPFLLFHHLLFN